MKIELRQSGGIAGASKFNRKTTVEDGHVVVENLTVMGPQAIEVDRDLAAQEAQEIEELARQFFDAELKSSYGGAVPVSHPVTTHLLVTLNSEPKTVDATTAPSDPVPVEVSALVQKLHGFYHSR